MEQTEIAPNHQEALLTPVARDICQIKANEYFVTYGRLKFCFAGHMAEKMIEERLSQADFLEKAQNLRLEQTPDRYYIAVFESVTQPDSLLFFKTLKFEQTDQFYNIIGKTIPSGNLLIAYGNIQPCKNEPTLFVSYLSALSKYKTTHMQNDESPNLTKPLRSLRVIQKTQNHVKSEPIHQNTMQQIRKIEICEQLAHNSYN